MKNDNGTRSLSLKQYRMTDLFLFALIMVVAELCGHFALKYFGGAAYFTFSFMAPVTLVVMMRWGWPSLFYAALSGVLYCALNGGTGVSYAIYGVGNLFTAFSLLLLKLIGKNNVTHHWYWALLMAVATWAFGYLGKAIMSAILLHTTAGFAEFFVQDCLSLAMTVVIVLSLRRFDGMVEDQKAFLMRMEYEKKKKAVAASSEDELAEIDGEALSILHRDDDMFL